MIQFNDEFQLLMQVYHTDLYTLLAFGLYQVSITYSYISLLSAGEENYQPITVWLSAYVMSQNKFIFRHTTIEHYPSPNREGRPFTQGYSDPGVCRKYRFGKAIMEVFGV